MSDKLFITGLMFWDSGFLPKNIVPDINNYRTWALSKGLIRNKGQLVDPNRVSVLKEHFKTEDQLAIVVHAYQDRLGRLWYLEYVYIPVKALIRNGKSVQIGFLQIRPGRWDRDGNILGYNEARFSFQYPGIDANKLCSTTTGKLLTQRFLLFAKENEGSYEEYIQNDGSKELTIKGYLDVKFTKTGNLYDMELEHKNSDASEPPPV